MRYSLLALVAVLSAGLLLTGCDSAAWNGQGDARNTPQPVLTDDPLLVTFLAGQTIDVGSVEVWNDTLDLWVAIRLTGGWLLTETHLAVATSLEGLPQTRSGNPIPGHFPYKWDFDPPSPDAYYSLRLEEWVPGTVLYFAVHGAVFNEVELDTIVDESAWADGEDFPGKNWATYFTYTVQEPR